MSAANASAAPSDGGPRIAEAAEKCPRAALSSPFADATKSSADFRVAVSGNTPNSAKPPSREPLAGVPEWRRLTELAQADRHLYQPALLRAFAESFRQAPRAQSRPLPLALCFAA